MLIMFWLTLVSQWWAVYSSRSAEAPDAAVGGNVARDLLQSAHALAGLDPHEAQRLRLAASAYLSVVR